MRPKTLALLLITAAVLVGLAVLTSKHKQQAVPSQVGAEVLPNMDPNRVARLVVTGPDGKVTVSKTENRWVCDDAFGYAADFETVRKVLLSLSDLTVGQVVRLETERRGELNLQPPSAATNAGTHVELFDGSGETIASLLIGDTRTRAPSGDQPVYGGGFQDGRYVAPDGGETVFLVGETLDEIGAVPTEWLDTDLVNVPAASVQKIAITDAEGNTVQLSRNEEKGRVTLESLAENEEEDSSKLYSVESALSYLRFDEVADPSLSDEALGMDAPASFRVWTDTREIYEILIGKTAADGDGRYVRISVSAAPEEEAANEEPEDEAAAATDAEPTVEQKVAALNDTLRGWTYVVASYKTDAMTRTRDELVKEKEEETEPDEASEETGGSL